MPLQRSEDGVKLEKTDCVSWREGHEDWQNGRSWTIKVFFRIF